MIDLSQFVKLTSIDEERWPFRVNADAIIRYALHRSGKGSTVTIQGGQAQHVAESPEEIDALIGLSGDAVNATR